jgi:ABC-type multidrug transport system ATPase subunit
MLKINKLVKKYEDSDSNTLNISDVTFKPSKIIRIIGPNGIGKTTFLSVISGLSFFEGEIIFNNTSIKQNYQKYLSMISYVGNKLFLYDLLTGEEMIKFVQKMLPVHLNLTTFEIFKIIYQRYVPWNETKTQHCLSFVSKTKAFIT